MSLCCEVLSRLKGKTLVTAESLTGGGIGAALTAVPGSSEVYKGGIISYTNWVKENLLGVPREILETYGAVSQWTAEAMAAGVRKSLDADIGVSVTGLAGPSGDEFGHPVGTVFIGYADDTKSVVRHFVFEGNRDAVRSQTIKEALELILMNQQ
jgi:PncC family amidohydrolase